METLNLNRSRKRTFFICAFTILFVSFSSFANAKNRHKNLINSKFTSLEKRFGGRLGIYALDTSSKKKIMYRANERFPLGSSNKVMGVAAILKKSETTKSLLEKRIYYKKSDLISWSPITKKYIKLGMTISQLANATIIMSDNTAINLIMKKLGGPKAVTKFARFIGDKSFNLNRLEPELNTAIPGDLRDTTTPKAMGNSLYKLVLGNALGVKQRKLLKTWLIKNKTGDNRIRAGTPKNWIVGDKTGTSAYGTTIDVGIIWPPHKAPIIITVYYTQSSKKAAPNEKIIELATRMVVKSLAN